MNFNNIQPRTREQRASLKNKEKIEEKFIQERNGEYLHNTENAKVFASDTKSTHYITETDRFDRDYLNEQKKDKGVKIEKLGKQIEKKRDEMIEREGNRWKLMEEEKKREDDKLLSIQQNHLIGKKNFSSAAYNPISLEYDKNKPGEMLKYQDELYQVMH